MPPIIRVGPGPWGYRGPGPLMDHPWLGGLVALVLIALLVALALAALAVLVREDRGRHHPVPAPSPPTNDEALRILDERFARGEIEAGEYTSRRDLLRQSA